MADQPRKPAASGEETITGHTPATTESLRSTELPKEKRKYSRRMRGGQEIERGLSRAGASLGDAVAATPVHGQGADPSAGLTPDDLAGHGGQRQPVPQHQQPAQPGILLAGLAGLHGLDPKVLVLFVQGRIVAADRLPVHVVGPEIEGAAVDADEEALDRGDRDRHELAGPPGAPAPRLHRQEQ